MLMIIFFGSDFFTFLCVGLSAFSLLSEEISSIQKSSEKKKSSKLKKISKSIELDDTLKIKLNDFEEENPIVVILCHFEGKDKFFIRQLHFSKDFITEMTTNKLKKINCDIIEKIIHDKYKRLGSVSVWPSFFVSDTMKILNEYNLKVNSSFISLVKFISCNHNFDNRYHNALIIDFRIKNSKQEFIYLPDGSRVYLVKLMIDNVFGIVVLN